MLTATKNENHRIAGCDVNPLDETACTPYLGWLADRAEMPEGGDGIAWALGHFDDGVTWGRWDQKAGTWASGHDVAPSISPAIRRETLQELRLFGGDREILIWRTRSGLHGRKVSDVRYVSGAAALAPVDEARVLRGSHIQVELGDGFTHVVDGTGARQVLPMRVTNEELRSRSVRLMVRHYFERNDETGAVRIALTRLVGLQGGQHGD